MTGVVMAAVGGGGRRVSFSTISVSESKLSPTNAQAGFEFRRDGTIYSYRGASGYAYVADWVSPTSSTVGDNYWIRVTATSGAFSTSAGAGWLQLSSTRYWDELTAADGTQATTFTVEIATDSGGSTIVFTRTGNAVTAERSP